MKVCTKCGKEKPFGEFSKDKNKKDGLSNWCKGCSKQYYQENKERISEQRKRYYQDNIEKARQYYQDKKDEISKQNQKLEGRYFLYKRNATRKGREFGLTLEQFEEITSQPCHYCGGYTENKEFCGIDRVDNDVGYVLENCVPCCFRCNAWKGKLTTEEFLNHAKDIVRVK